MKIGNYVNFRVRVRRMANPTTTAVWLLSNVFHLQRDCNGQGFIMQFTFFFHLIVLVISMSSAAFSFLVHKIYAQVNSMVQKLLKFLRPPALKRTKFFFVAHFLKPLFAANSLFSSIVNPEVDHRWFAGAATTIPRHN